MNSLNFNIPDPLSITILFTALGLAPFVAVMVSSFVKIIVITNLIRNALGIQQIPPNMVLNGLAIIISLYIMAPVIEETYDIIQDTQIVQEGTSNLQNLIKTASTPIKNFLIKHSDPRERTFFASTAKSIWPKDKAESLTSEDILVLVPAFTVTELTSAFKIGFLLYLPFITIDLIVSNILLAMGMMMVSPMTISLPFKILLFVVVNGWSNLIRGIVLTYQ